MAKLLVRVVTTDLKTGKLSVREIDHDDFEDRKWLGKHCFWAMRNGYSVETSPVRFAKAGA